jgi:hypothetical protein
MAGIEVLEARINYLAYAPEIAAVMLRRQQASAIISAREKIVEGAVSMVKMALDKLSADQVVELDEEKKAAMVSNLLVVLCADEAAQPVVNTGTLNQLIYKEGKWQEGVFNQKFCAEGGYGNHECARKMGCDGSEAQTATAMDHCGGTEEVAA